MYNIVQQFIEKQLNRAFLRVWSRVSVLDFQALGESPVLLWSGTAK